MSSLRLVLFGTPQLICDHQTMPLRRSKALALLAYLAVTQQPQHRDALTALLWPEFDTASARNNLRRELSLLKTSVGIDLLRTDRTQVALNPAIDLWLDVAVFEAQIATVRRHAHATGTICTACAAALAEAERLYNDDFMAGFGLPDSPAFDDWQFFRREELRQQLAFALQALIAWHSAAAGYDSALRYARRWLSLDPLHEPAQRELMRLYAWSGQQAAALRQYNECVRVLHTELGAEPEPETSDLFMAIKARRLATPAAPVDVGDRTEPTATSSASVIGATPAPPIHNLPPLSTTFVGRRQELMDILRRITDPDCRLLTMTGPGGIGKTQLALQAAHTIVAGWSGAEEIADGVVFVPLAAVTTADDLLAALASALRFNFYPNVSPKQQLLDYLRTKRMLIVLDNFEQLLHAAEIVDDLIVAAARVRLLVTSREALNLQQEWFHPVEGLSFPSAEDATTDLTQLAQFDAIQLFEQSARRARIDFRLDREYAQVVRLCRLVEGIPLAIELAASWLRLLSVGEIVAALEQGLDILTTRSRNVADRHRSMRTVLEASWRLLSSDEARILARLSVFSGGFTATAAEAVAGATLNTLAILVEKSLIRGDADGRYGMHELLRQFAAEQLARDPDDAQRTRQAHSAFYIDVLAARSAAIAGYDQPTAVAEILAEHDNVRAAWQWAVDHHNIAAIAAVGRTFAVFYEFRGRYHEGVTALERAIDCLRAQESHREHDLILAARLVDLAWLYIRLGDLSHARTALNESHALFEAHQINPRPDQASDPVLGLGMVALLQGQYAEAARLGELALQRCADPQRRTNRPRALFLLMKAAHAQGYYPAARRFGEEAIAVAAEHGHSWLIASLYNELGTTLCAMGEYTEAHHHYQIYYTLREAFDDRRGMATALHGLGTVALCQQHCDEARSLFERSLNIIRQVGARVDTGLALDGLAAAAIATGERDAARHYLAEALQLALSSASQPLLLAVIVRAAQLLLPTAKRAWGPEALVLVLQHPATDSDMTRRAYALLEAYERELPPDIFAASVSRGQQGNLQLFTEQLQAILQTSIAALDPAVPILS